MNEKKLYFLAVLFVLLNGFTKCVTNNTDETKYHINELFALDTIFVVDGVQDDGDYRLSVYNNNVYIAKNQFPVLKNKRFIFEIYEYNCVTKKSRLLNLNFGDTLKNFSLKRMEFDDEYIYFIDWNYRLLVYDRLANKVTKIIKFNRPFKYIKICSDRLYLFESGIYSSNKKMISHTHLGILDLENYVLIYKDLPDSKNYQFSFFGPSQYIDVNCEYVMISEIDEYLINLYGFDSYKFDSLKISHDNWCYIDKGLYSNIKPNPNIFYYPKSYMDSLRPFYFNMSHIKKVNFINDTLIVVYWTIPENGNKQKDVFDILIYNKKERFIKPLYLSLTQKKPERKDYFIKTKILPISGGYKIANNYLIELQPIPISLFQNKTYLELYEQINEYYLENDLKYSVIIRKFER